MKEKSKLEKYLSEARLKPYFRACDNSVERAVELYQLNVRLGASFFPLLSILEVTLRNAIDFELSKHFENNNWFDKLETALEEKRDRQKDEIMEKYGRIPKHFQAQLEHTIREIGQSKRQLNYRELNVRRTNLKIYLRKLDWYKGKDEVDQYECLSKELTKDLADEPINISHSEMIANMNFSFWVSLFKKEIYKILNGRLIGVFPRRNSQTKIQKISTMLDEIRAFRNRVAHNEPLFFRQKKFSMKRVKKVYEHIIEILGMMDEDVEDFSRETYVIHENIRNVEDFIVELPKLVGFEG